jgi:[protein-PII] uridylyltransferase
MVHCLYFKRLESTMTTPSTPVSVAAALAALSTEKELAAFVVRERAALWDRWTPETGGRAAMQEHAALLDAVLRRLFALSRERTENSNAAIPASGIAVLATGGYGQRLLAPHSDLDVTLLAERDDDSPTLRSLFGLVMDVLLSGARIKVGYAYRTLSEAGGETLDHQTQTALLDARVIAGDSNLFARFDTLFHKNLQAADFLFRKRAEREKVREKAGQSPYIVEPNVKEGTGGIRDIQTAYWMARVRFGKSGEAVWHDLVRRKVITPGEQRTLSECREFLLATRCALHLSAGERREVLTIGRQEAVAARLGFADEGTTPGVERFMHRYYSAAAEAYRIAEKVIGRCFDAPLPLDAEGGLASVRGRINITDPVKAEMNPLWSLYALDFCQTHQLELALSTEEAILKMVAAGDWPATEEGRRRAGEAFTTLLVKPGDSCETVRRMQRTGLLRALLPELDDCMGLIPYDPAHAYTVGEHSIQVLANLLELRDSIGDGDLERGSYRAILKNLDSPLPLFLAALLHDIGKQWPVSATGERQAHEVIGAEHMPAICARLDVGRDVAETVTVLVRQHLLLAETSRLRDLSQPATIREVMRLVGDPETLRMLYLLTYADTRAVGPGVWTEMNARLLEELYERTESAFQTEGQRDEAASDTPAGESPVPAITDAHLATVRQRLGRQLAAPRTRRNGRAADTPPTEEVRAQIQEHVEAMPAAYLLNTPLEVIRRHLELVREWQENGGGIVLDQRAVGGTGDSAQTELTVVTRDDSEPGLLSKMTGALFACDVNLHSAQVFSRSLPGGIDSERLIIDTLRVDFRGRSLSVEKRGAVEEALQIVLGGEMAVGDFLARRRKTVPDSRAVRAFHIDAAASPDYTLVDIEATDEPGLVYFLAALFTGQRWNIHAARISTWGGSVRCAFYLTDAEGHLLSENTALDQLWRALAASR